MSTRCSGGCSGAPSRGAAFGHAKIASKSLWVRGLNVLAATVSTPLAAPVVATARLRGGNAGSARGGVALVAEAINISREPGANTMVVVRADSAYYAGTFVAACRRNGARFSVNVGMDPKPKRAIANITDDAWTAIEYPNAIYDEQASEWISDAEIAEVDYTAFASTPAHRSDWQRPARRRRGRGGRTRPVPAGRAIGEHRYSSPSPPVPPAADGTRSPGACPKGGSGRTAWLGAFDATHRPPQALAA
jgi:hypothetical protein